MLPVRRRAQKSTLVCQPGMPTIDGLEYRVFIKGRTCKTPVDYARSSGRVGAAASLAPLHEASAVTIIREGQARFLEANHYACFKIRKCKWTSPERLRRIGLWPLACRALRCSGNDRDAGLRHVVRSSVMFTIFTDACTVSDRYAFVQDRAPDSAVTSDGAVIEDD